MNIQLLHTPPADWMSKINKSIQQPAFSNALRELGYTPFYATDGNAAALVQLRGHWPLAGRLLGRAYVYPSNETAPFIDGLIDTLKRRSIPFVRFGNTMWGVTRPESLAAHPLTLQERFTFVVDTTESEDKLFNAIEAKRRTAVRRAQKHGVTIREAATREDIHWLYPVLAQTGARAGARGISISMPVSFFESILNNMVPLGLAVYYIAEYQSQPIAVMLNFVQGDTMLYYAGGSLREFSKQNASSLLQWHAIQQCRALGLHHYDLGGCSPNLPESDPRYGVFAFKQEWGGTLEKFYNAEFYLSPSARTAQVFLRKHVWPLYRRLKCR